MVYVVFGIDGVHRRYDASHVIPEEGEGVSPLIVKIIIICQLMRGCPYNYAMLHVRVYVEQDVEHLMYNIIIYAHKA